jgi:aromatic ring-cleaving dioxygenase
MCFARGNFFLDIVMTYREVSTIVDWHAHLYFNAETRDAAWQLREALAARFESALKIGRFHERPVGPHPMWSFQLAFECAELPRVMEWLALNHGTLDVFIHPNTGDALRDHRDSAVWIGRSHELVLSMFGQ